MFIKKFGSGKGGEGHTVEKVMRIMDEDKN